VILENLYDLVLEVEQLRRDQPPHNEEEAYQTWSVLFNPSALDLFVHDE
jgi:DNA topoisomerase 2-associated protein PAT1